MPIGVVVPLLLLPFLAIFVYAAWHEYRRFRKEGRSTYGLTYDPESNTTFVGAIPDSGDSYDPGDYDPENTGSEDGPDGAWADDTDKDHNEQDNRR
ncbi:hypothetical protein [uncultured Mameliella sp.]|uniref:hypothetical protein n=1 Tax=uncultured Mameliella sp. TaxID=1447087 RepID=UPI002628EF1C|nr:hypothetical protein [uncultured Mameliella sp.]